MVGVSADLQQAVDSPDTSGIPHETAFQPFLQPPREREDPRRFHLGETDRQAACDPAPGSLRPVAWSTINKRDQPCEDCLRALDLVPADHEIGELRMRGDTWINWVYWCPACYRDLRGTELYYHLVGHDPADFGLSPLPDGGETA